MKWLPALLFLLPLPTNADWQVHQQKDEMTDKVTKFATVKSKNTELSVGRYKSGIRIAIKRLNPRIEFKKQENVEFRVDKNDMFYLAVTNQASFLVIIDTTEEMMKKIITGNHLKIRYKTKTGKIIDTFSIPNTSAIFNSIDIQP